MSKTLPLLFLLIFSAIINASAQNLTQTIRGTITDKQSQALLPGVTITLPGTNPIKGSVTDADGKFKITDVAPGRYDVKVTFLGYMEVFLGNVPVTSGKEVILDIALEESVNSLKEVVVSSSKNHETMNEMTSVSARSFSTEEVNRFAGGRSDPSRLAANFAGVSSPDDSRNDIVIRGNSPTGVLWRIEGLDIPNPNHFSTVGTTGGPVSALNTNILRNSDFFTSAFPAEYGNANAGVFDLGFRDGNSEKREHTIQIGALTGLEAMTEGPIDKEKGSSYVIAYRYSFTGLAQSMGINIGTTATPFYQDLSFKVSGGYTKFGKFTLFGLGGTSTISFLHNKVDSTDLFADPTTDSYFTSNLGLVGLKHFIRIGEKSYVSTVLGATYASSVYNMDTITKSDDSPVRVLENRTTRINYSVNTSFNSKISSRLFVKVGAIAEVMDLNLFYRTRRYTPSWNQIWDFNDYTLLYQGYAQAKYNFTDRLVMNLGVHAQFLTLNNSESLEPRFGLKYQISDKHILSAGYGLNGQMQPTDVYFYRTLNASGTYDESNRNLGFTRSHHFALGYDYMPAKDWHIKSEVYYQMLFDVPVTQTPGSFSMLNQGASFDPNNQGYLINSGTGTNYGAELTIEKYFSKGYYAMFTGSLYESKYKGSDGIERNTAFNGEYVYNVLLGKEFKIGKEKRNAITIDTKLTQAGGRYYTPVNLAASQAIKQEVLQGDAYAFTQRNPDFFRLDMKAGFTFNSKKRRLSHVIFFDLQNVTNHKNVFALRYNPVSNQINTAYQIGFFPNFGYKIQF